MVAAIVGKHLRQTCRSRRLSFGGRDRPRAIGFTLPFDWASYEEIRNCLVLALVACCARVSPAIRSVPDAWSRKLRVVRSPDVGCWAGRDVSVPSSPQWNDCRPFTDRGNAVEIGVVRKSMRLARANRPAPRRRLCRRCVVGCDGEAMRAA